MLLSQAGSWHPLLINCMLGKRLPDPSHPHQPLASELSLQPRHPHLGSSEETWLAAPCPALPSSLLI